jgi:2-oxoglutarate ferredoxin oxidoreductase subunit alpha
MRGNEAIAQAALDAGCRAYFGYPITPQNQIADYLAARMPEVGGVFLQAESEVAAINMVYGAASTSARAMTSSSSPGISLKQEGISYIAESELPCVIVNIMRGGSGLGNIAPAQADYFQAVKGGGHGDYRTFVLAGWSVQELYDLTREAFDIADRYQEVVEPEDLPAKRWATGGAKGRPRNIINSLYIKEPDLEEVNLRIQGRYDEAAASEVRYATEHLAGAKIALVGYGTAARISVAAVEQGRAAGLPVGLFRPISLFPFPSGQIADLAEEVEAILVVELSLGQLAEDVRLAVEGRCPVHLYGRTGGIVPTPAQVLAEIKRLAAER